MKNKFLKLTSIASLALLGLNSCSEDETTYNPLSYPNDKFVAFTETGSSVSEASGQVTVTALYANNNYDSDVSMAFNITSDDATVGVDYDIVDSQTSFNFTTGETTDTITIQIYDNTDVDGSRSLNINLVGGNGIFAGYPGNPANNSVYTLTIEDDDCPYTFQELADASWTGSDNASGSEGPNDTQISMSFNGTDLLIEGIAYGWLTNPGYWDEVVINSNPVVAQIDAAGNLTIANQYLCTTTWLGNVQPDYNIQATGTFSSCNRTMIINYDLIQGGGILRSYTETINY